MSPRLQYNQQEMGSGLLSRIQNAIERFACFDPQRPFRCLDIGCANGFFVERPSKPLPRGIGLGYRSVSSRLCQGS